jgi:hypothetical protein
MTSKLGEGSEAYASPAQTIIGSPDVSVLLTIFPAPAGFYLPTDKRLSLALLIAMFACSESTDR